MRPGDYDTDVASAVSSLQDVLGALAPQPAPQHQTSPLAPPQQNPPYQAQQRAPQTPPQNGLAQFLQHSNQMRAQPMQGMSHSPLAVMGRGQMPRSFGKGGRVETTRPTPRPNRFEGELKALDWYREFPEGQKPDLTSPDYDYETAMSSGIRPQRDPYDGGRFHWLSSTPDGRMLKAPGHPTAWKEYYMRETGRNPDAEGVRDYGVARQRLGRDFVPPDVLQALSSRFRIKP